jgi:hypothetical protein
MFMISWSRIGIGGMTITISSTTRPVASDANDRADVSGSHAFWTVN